MITVSLRYLEERLVREAPALSWTCEPVQTGNLLNGTNLPEQIQVQAKRGGIPLARGPFYLSGECLVRWGVDASAALICNEFTPKSRLDWDRLAEI